MVEVENYTVEAQCNVACMEQKRGHGVACVGQKHVWGRSSELQVRCETGEQSYRLRVNFDPSHPVHSESSHRDARVHNVGVGKREPEVWHGFVPQHEKTSQ